MTIGDAGEFGFIAEITAGLTMPPAVSVGPGDDAAVLAVDGSLVATVDTMVENVHFRPDWVPAHLVGRRAVASAASDINAMGATPIAVLVSFTARPDLDEAWAVECMAGIRAECDTAGAALVGGDTTRGSQLVIAVTVLGQLTTAPLLRSGALPGQVVAVRGRLGWSAAGLAVLSRGFRSPRAVVSAYQCPEPPYGAGLDAVQAHATAMIDVSDGLLADLAHIAVASGVSIDLDPELFDVPEPLQAVAQATGRDPLGFMLTGGEDHALVATFPSAELPHGWWPVGRVVEADEDGPVVLVAGRPWDGPQGWTHFVR